MLEMNDCGQGSILSHKISKGDANMWMYIFFLIAAKLSRVFGIYLSYDLLKVIHVVPFLCIIKAGSSLFFIFLQKPFTSGRKISKNQWFRLTKHAALSCFVQLLWLFGLTLCGPLRTVLLFEHSDKVLVVAAGALFMSAGSTPSKVRGAIVLLAGVVCLLLFDHDDLTSATQHEPETHKHSSVITHVFYHVMSLLGWSDHKGGVMLLCITLVLQCAHNNSARKLSLDIGGAKRLHALSTLMSFILLTPWALFVSFTSQIEIESRLSLVFPLTIVIVFVFVLDFYIDAISSNNVSVQIVARTSSIASFIGALFLAASWNHPLIDSITTTSKFTDINKEDHILSPGVIFSLCAFLLGTHMLSDPGRSSRGSFIGYAPGGKPLYSFTSDAIHKTTDPITAFLKHTLKRVLDDSNSRRILYFLLINLGFTFVELLYGVLTNSLGLISDGFHMLFDCSALVMGLCAAVMSRWKPTRTYPYGYDRIEVLSGFINGLFLVIIALFVFAEALSRIIHPQEVKTEKLLTVSVMGLCVNLIGIFAFRGSHGHSHGFPSGHSHKHGHGHSHTPRSGSSHGASSASPCPDNVPHNTNMEGVFLHILADTLGSVGVIISSILIEHFGWTMADPICSIFIAGLIFLSVIPLLKETATFLLLATPTQLVEQLRSALEKALSFQGVVGYRDAHFWHHTSSRIFGTIHIQATSDVAEQRLTNQVRAAFTESGLSDITVQLEKQSYFHHLQGLSKQHDHITQYTQNTDLLTVNPIPIVKAV